MLKVYILLNKLKGWKIVADGKYRVDSTKPIAILETQKEAIDYCNEKGLEIIRVCR